MSLALLRRKFNIYAAVAAMTPKLFMAYAGWVWLELFVQIVAMTILFFFWQGIYANTASVSGLSLQQMLNYILLAQLIGPAVGQGIIFFIGHLVREGAIGIELLRPLNFQFAAYIRGLAEMGFALFTKIPLFIVALLVFRLQLPSDPLVWLCFVVALLLGQSVIFCFDWLFACLAFYSTEVWGLGVLRGGIGYFFSGGLIPISIMPGWLQGLAAAMPFAQAVYAPIGLLSGAIPLSDAPRVWLVQLIWLGGLGFISNRLFRIAVRKVTVQGG
jgi:ABC-2 type transport system permease protein